MRNRPIAIFVVAVVLLIVSVPTTAHHGAAAFDIGKEIVLKGTVTEWIWSNPHCLLRFDVTDENGQVVPWVAETQNPRNMSNRGWARTSFTPGDQVTVTVQPVKNGRRLGRILKAVLPDGQTLAN
jgi:hypothetical protein